MSYGRLYLVHELALALGVPCSDSVSNYCKLDLDKCLSAQLMVSLLHLVTKFEMQRVDHWLACLF